MAAEVRMTSPAPGEDSDPPGVASVLQLLSGGAAREGVTTADASNPYRGFLQAVGVAVYTTDKDGRLTFFNDAATALWGYQPVIGDAWWCGSWRLFHPDGQPMAHDECPMATALREGRPVRGAEAILERPDGRRVWFTPFPTPLLGDDGQLVGGVNVLIDVTERRHAEDALRDAAERLQVSNAVKDEFLGLVSHELRTPVTTIFGNARLLRDRGRRLSELDRRSMVADIAEDSERLLGIIENLLILARMGSGEEMSSEPQMLGRVVRRSTDLFTKRHRTRQVEVAVASAECIVEADRTSLELVVGNLLGNAHKYSPAGTPIEISVGTSADDPGMGVVRVSDRGIGLGSDDPDELFAPFRRADAARARAGGMGIGLAVCRRIVDSLGGRIWAEPRDGGGSTFAFALPIALEEPSEDGRSRLS
jgi:PAS domain S-box-containing protein